MENKPLHEPVQDHMAPPLLSTVAVVKRVLTLMLIQTLAACARGRSGSIRFSMC